MPERADIFYITKLKKSWTKHIVWFLVHHKTSWKFTFNLTSETDLQRTLSCNIWSFNDGHLDHNEDASVVDYSVMVELVGIHVNDITMSMRNNDTWSMVWT